MGPRMSWGSQIRVESTRVPGFASEPRRDFREDYEISRIFFVSRPPLSCCDRM
jgi:hypothetical protein